MSWEPREDKSERTILDKIWNTLGKGAAKPVFSMTDEEVEHELAEQAAGRLWTMPAGFVHALFEVAVDAIKRCEDPTDTEALAAAIGATNLDTVVGKVAWGQDNVPEFARKNIAKTPLVGGQWRRKDDGSFDLVIVENGNAPEIPLGGTLETLS